MGETYFNQENVVINLEKLSCKVGYKYLLKEIDWNVHNGEHWVVFGMNGSGKNDFIKHYCRF